MPAARRLAERLVRAAPLAARATKETAVRAAHLPPLEAIRFGDTMRENSHVEHLDHQPLCTTHCHP
jgi:hypothetical protein